MDIPVFDFNNPWVAIIQIALAYVLPLLTGLVSDRLAKASYKVLLLGVLNIISAGLTWLLDIALAQAWATIDYTALINVVVNAALTFFLAQGVYQGIIKPTGQADRVARAGISLIPADPDRALAEAQTNAEAARSTIAERSASAEVIAKRIVTEAIAESEKKILTAAKRSATTAVNKAMATQA